MELEAFDFQKLTVYQRIRSLNKVLLPFLYQKLIQLDPYLVDQLKRASLSAALNLAEGTGRTSSADKKRFYVMSRSSVYECVALLDTLVDTRLISPAQFSSYLNDYTEISKMLYALYKKA
ncbi:MAG: four helix bundle protein [Saprospiraceae bacterium]|nr:four helix bundle protein [Saprospiraceae bacterium]